MENLTIEKSDTTTTQSTIVGLMKNYSNYNLWANATLVGWLRTKPEALVEQEVLSSFPSIKLTLLHIQVTERYWFSVLNKTEFQFESAEYQTLDDLYVGFLEQSVALADYVNAMNEEQLVDNTLVVNPWFQCDFQNFDYVMQVMNHGTYHRGQIITIGRNLGFTDAPMTDYNFYNVHGK